MNAQIRRGISGTSLESYVLMIALRPPVKFVFPVFRFYQFLWCSIAPAKWICVLCITRFALGPQSVRAGEEFRRPVCTGAVRLGYKYFR